MKKSLIAIAAAVFAGTVFAQGALKPIAGASIDKNTKLPTYWLVQAQTADKATVKVALDNKGKTKSVTLSPVKSNLEFFGNEVKAVKGDEFTLTAKVKGKGKVQLSYFGYKTVGGFLYYITGKTIELNGTEQTISESFTVKDGKEYPVGKIRPSLRVLKDSTCEVTSIVMTEE